MNSRTKRIVKRSCLGIVAIAIVTIIVLLLLLDGIIRRRVASQSTASLNLPTQLDSARLSLRGGHLSLHGLSIAAPQGFPTAEMFALKDVSVTVSYRQLTHHPIHINQIVVQNPKLVIEHRNGRMNVMAAIQGMPKGESSGFKLIIDAMEIKETTVVFRPGLPMLNPQYTFVLPTIALQDIGNADGAANGAAIKDVVTLILNAIVQKAAESGKLPMGLGSLFQNGASLSNPATAPPAGGATSQPIWKGLNDLLK